MTHRLEARFCQTKQNVVTRTDHRVSDSKNPKTGIDKDQRTGRDAPANRGAINNKGASIFEPRRL